MPHDWQPPSHRSAFRVPLLVACAVLFVAGVVGFLGTLAAPFTQPRLHIICCDADPATADASPLADFAAAHPDGTTYREQNGDPSLNWLASIEAIASDVRPGDAVLVSLRGRWSVTGPPAIQSAMGAKREVSLPIADVLSELAAIKDAGIVLCLDDCDPAVDSFAEGLGDLALPPNVRIIASHGFGEESLPLPMRGRSVFGGAIARGLTDATSDGRLTIGQFTASVYRDVASLASEMTDRRQSQTPRVVGRSSSLANRTLHNAMRVGPADAPKPVDAAESPDADALPILSELSTAAETILEAELRRETPVPILRSLRRDVLALERRWRLSVPAPRLHDDIAAMKAVCDAIASDGDLPFDAAPWAVRLSQLRRQTGNVDTHLDKRDRIDELLDRPITDSAIRAFAAAHPNALSSRTSELIARLLADDAIDSDLRSQVLRNRLQLERHDTSAHHRKWSDAAWAAAESAALRGERHLLDQVVPDWPSLAADDASTATQAIEAAIVAETLQARTHLAVRRTLLQLPDLLAMDMSRQFWETDSADVGRSLDRLIEAVGKLRRFAAQDTPVDVAEAQRILDELETQRSRLLAPIARLAAQAASDDVGQCATRERLLRSGLVSGSTRQSLRIAWQQTNIPESPRIVSPGSRVVVRGLSGRLRTVGERCRAYASLFGSTDALHDDGEDPLAAAAAVHAARLARSTARRATLADSIGDALNAPVSRATATKTLAAWQRLDGISSVEHLPSRWLKLAERQRLEDQLRSSDAALRAYALRMSDAADWERTALTASRRMAIEARPFAAAWPAPPQQSHIDVAANPNVSIPTDEAAQVQVAIRNEASQPQTIRVSLAFDDRLFDVSSVNDQSAASIEAGTRRPLRFAAGESRTLTYRVQRRTPEPPLGKLIVRASTQDHISRATAQLTPVRTFPVTLRLSGDAIDVLSNDDGHRAVMVPNEPSRMQLQLHNRTGTPQTIEATLDAISSDGRQTTRLAAVTQTVAPDATAPLSFDAADFSKQTMDATQGLLLHLTDPSTGRSQTASIRLAARRPSQLATTTATLDPVTGRLRVTVDAIEPSRLPIEGIPVALAGGPKRPPIADRLSPERTSVSLACVVDPLTDHTLAVDIAGWPRSARFAVERGAIRRLTEPAIRIVDPEVDTIVQSPDTITASVEVDGPPGGFASPGDTFRVGLDANGDRLLTDEPTIEGTRDRDVSFRVLSVSPSGEVLIGCRVSDFVVPIASSSIRNRRVNLIGSLTLAGSATVWSESRPIIFDQQPPRLTDLSIEPGPEIVAGVPLVITLAADDPLSGVAAIHAGFDATRSGVFSNVAAPIAGVPLGDGRWRIDVPTKPLTEGRHLLLTSGADAAGNLADALPTWLTVISQEEAAARLANRTVPLSGQLLYGPQPAAGLTITLTPAPAKDADGESATAAKPTPPSPIVQTSGQNGQFRFAAVRGGRYTLSIDGVLRGVRLKRTRPIDISVDSPPAPILIRLDHAPETASKPASGATPTR